VDAEGGHLRTRHPASARASRRTLVPGGQLVAIIIIISAAVRFACYIYISCARYAIDTMCVIGH
jgi:hypothetical protein